MTSNTKAQYQVLNPAGRAILKPCHYHAEFELTNDEYPLHLSTGRRPLHFHTRTKTGRTKELQEGDPEPYIQLAEQDARSRGIKEGDWLIVESRRGKVELKARVGLMAEGQVFVPFHFGYFDAQDGKARAANELTQERWDPVSKQPLFKSGAVKVTKVEKQDDGQVHIHEQQTSAIKCVEKTQKPHTAGSRSKPPQLERYLEFWLAIIFDAFKSLRSICDDLIPQVAQGDWEVSIGMQVMHRIITSCVDHFEPYVLKYRAVGDFGHDINDKLKDNLFPADVIGHFSGSESFDTLVVLQGFYTFLSQVEAHLITLSPSAQATWDKAFISAVAFVQTQVERMQAWTKQQLKSRGPQALLVPCQPAADLKKRFEEGKSVEGVRKDEEIDKSD
ncbi:hypothetical protein LTR84_001180 [Exophiala bonariae]|uniref:Molybdopterin dinucleotide-binding domain-containing protein n=1 Tax=Exophiala bonariae TaxID=1690606 RepID=A0AAV9NVE0_9EURO|nr:hypothetical protein LTR84_001180 [Exophiala bonariae]